MESKATSAPRSDVVTVSMDVNNDGVPDAVCQLEQRLVRKLGGLFVGLFFAVVAGVVSLRW